MAEQKSEDTKPPMARRGARPFAGPTGAPSAARPFLRPAPPSQRPGPAPLAPPVVPGRYALGATAPAKPAAAPAPVDEAASSPRPAVPLDAFDAFDASWEQSDRPEATAAYPTAPPPLDETSLGSGVDAQHLWADEITAGGDATATPASSSTEPTRTTPTIEMPAWLADDAVRPAESSVEPAQPAAEIVTPDWSAPATDDAEATQDWTRAPMVPAANETLASEPAGIEAAEALGEPQSTEPPAEPTTPGGWSAEWTADVAEQRPRFEVVDEPHATEENAIPTDPRLVHGFRVSAALDRLAQRIRGGEIDVSSVAPEANDAAVLASVLAALLGGSSSR